MAIRDTYTDGTARVHYSLLAARGNASFGIWSDTTKFTLYDIAVEINPTTGDAAIYQLITMPANTEYLLGYMPSKYPAYWQKFNIQSGIAPFSSGSAPSTSEIRDKINLILSALKGYGVIA